MKNKIFNRLSSLVVIAAFTYTDVITKDIRMQLC